MSFVHRQQQHRYLITYDDKMEEFSPGSWTAWRRIDGEAGGDVEGAGSVVETASAELVSAMCAKWQASPFTCKSLDALHKQSQLGPARDREVRSNEKKEEQRKQKAARREREHVAAAERERVAAVERERVAATERERVAAAERERERRLRGGSGGSDVFASGSGGYSGGHGVGVGSSAQPPSPPGSVRLLHKQLRGL